MKRILAFCVVVFLAFSVQTFAQAPTFSFNDLKKIDEAIAERDSFKSLNEQLNKQINLCDQNGILLQKNVDNEHANLFETKKIYLSTMEALKEYRIVRRSLFVKILTLSVVRDKHDKDLESKISDLQKEIMNWNRPMLVTGSVIAAPPK